MDEVYMKDFLLSMAGTLLVSMMVVYATYLMTGW